MGEPNAADPERALALARGGDAPALGQLLELYRTYLRLLARLNLDRQVQAKVDPSDLVQDTFLKAHRHFGDFRGTTEGEFLAWLRTILATTLANVVRHYVGSQRRDVRLEQRLGDSLEHSAQRVGKQIIVPHSTPSQQAARRERAVHLADALERLPADYREAIILRHLEGLAFQEVAERMGRSVDSAKKLWARGLARLREMMEAAS